MLTRGTVRTWLEQLLISTTFVSEFTTHPLINIGSLYSNPSDSERGVRNALEELLYHRITRWKVNDMSFSLLLQQVDLADALSKRRPRYSGVIKMLTDYSQISVKSLGETLSAESIGAF